VLWSAARPQPGRMYQYHSQQVIHIQLGVLRGAVVLQVVLVVT
jgi:hypothetical protein